MIAVLFLKYEGIACIYKQQTQQHNQMKQSAPKATAGLALTRAKLIAQQESLARSYSKAIRAKTVVLYDKIKHLRVIYELTDFIEIHNLDGKKPYVGKLTAIIEVPTAIERMPFIEVEWAMRKEDLPKEVIGIYGEHISEAELFLTTKKSYLPVEAIKSKCFIFSIKEYGQLGLIADNVYFSRSSFDVEDERLIPGPTQWETNCMCQMPTNPDRRYVYCSECEGWFHQKCVKGVLLDVSFACSSCMKKKKRSKRSR